MAVPSPVAVSVSVCSSSAHVPPLSSAMQRSTHAVIMRPNVKPWAVAYAVHASVRVGDNSNVNLLYLARISFFMADLATLLPPCILLSI